MIVIEGELKIKRDPLGNFYGGFLMTNSKDPRGEYSKKSTDDRKINPQSTAGKKVKGIKKSDSLERVNEHSNPLSEPKVKK